MNTGLPTTRREGGPGAVRDWVSGSTDTVFTVIADRHAWGLRVSTSDELQNLATDVDAETWHRGLQRARDAADKWQRFGNELYAEAEALLAVMKKARSDSAALPRTPELTEAPPGWGHIKTERPPFGFELTTFRNELLSAMSKAYALAGTYQREVERIQGVIAAEADDSTGAEN